MPLVVIQTRVNPAELGLEPMVVGSPNYSCLIATAVAATECEHMLPWSKQTPFNSKLIVPTFC
jgi:hypothetical protein